MAFVGKFLIDTNIFIQAYHDYYAFDIAPSFWESLKQFAKAEKIVSIDKVKKELLNGKAKDTLSKWAVEEFSEWFMSTEDPKVIDSYSKIMEWAYRQSQYKNFAKAEFADVADSWLIAYAHAYNHTIVTHEKYIKDIKNKIPIPNVCVHFNIPYTNTFDMLRNLKSKIEILS